MLDAGCSNANKTFTPLYTAEDMFSKLEAFLKKEKFEIFLVTPDCYTIRAKFPEGYKYQGVSPTREIYNDKDELIWHNAELVNRGEIITQSLRNISKNLLSIMAGEPEVFEGGNISLSLVKEVMKDLGYETNDSVSFANCTYRITYTKPGKNFSYQIIGDIYNGNISIEKKYER